MGHPAEQQSFAEAIGVTRQDLGKADTLHYNIVTYVVEENYDRAIDELKSFINREWEYPHFRNRVERYVPHAIDLINAIRAKRKFPGVTSLPIAKQQELNEKYRHHFAELQAILKKIEKIHVELHLEDIRSTVWVVQAFATALFAIVAVAFMIEVSKGLFENAWIVIDDLFVKLSAWLMSFI